MNQLDRYKLLEPFYQEPYQTIYMAINKDKEDEVALVNTIDRDKDISDTDFEKLVHHLTNVSYYSLDDKLILVTSYNEGIPIINYLKNYPLDADERIALLTLYLKGIQEYDSLSASLQSCLIELNQIVVHNNGIFFNEIITLKSLKPPTTLHSKILQVVDAFGFNSNDATSLRILEFFNSGAFLNIQSLKLLYSTYIALIKNNNLPPLIIPQSISTPPTFSSAVLLENEHVIDEEDLTPPLLKDDVITIGLTEIKNIPSDIPISNPSKERQTRTFPWLWLFLIPIIAFAAWYIFNKEDIPNPPQASFQVVATQNGWMFQSTSISSEPAQLSSYDWKIYHSGLLLIEQQSERFSFKPESEGQYTIRLVVTDTYLQKSSPYELILTYDLTQDMTEDAQSNDVHDEADQIVGSIIDDQFVYYSRPSSKRITLGTQESFEIIRHKNTYSQHANLMSIWIKSSDLKPISLLIKTYTNGQLSYETQVNYTPNMMDFQLFTYTLKNKAFDTLTIEVQSLNNYIWFDSFILETAK